MKITIMLHDKRPFINSRVFQDFEFKNSSIDPILQAYQDSHLDVYIYPYGTTAENLKAKMPIASQIRRRQGYLVINTLAWRRYYESHNQD